MNSTKKRIALFVIVVVFVFTLFAGKAYTMTNGIIQAFAAADDTAYAYYYDNLKIEGTDGKQRDYALAKRFYLVLEEINKSGDFKKGKISYDLTSLLTSEQIAAWVEKGNLEIPKAFGAARDSFLMDHPELFYIDVYKIMISAGRTNGKYVAYIDSGKEPNVYRNKSFKSETAVNEAITKYNEAIKKIADAAEESIKGNVTKRDLDLANAVNDSIAKQVVYDFGTYNDGMNGNASSASQAFTAYGALVNKKAVCQGYSFAYKAVMDYLKVPCVIVSGYSIGKDKKGNDTQSRVGHSWNYVQLETSKKIVETEGQATAKATEMNHEWFAYDTTWNSVQRSRKYSAMDYSEASKQHMPYEVISSSNYALKYPVLSAINYSKALDPNEKDLELSIGGFTYNSKYTGVEDTYTLNEYVTYNGKNAVELFESEGLRLVLREYYIEKGEKKWLPWQDLYNLSKAAEKGYTGSGIRTEDGKTAAYIPSNSQYSQYAVISGVTPDIYDDFLGFGYYAYNENRIKEENFIFKSHNFENEMYGTYTPAPYLLVEGTTPYMGGALWISDRLSEGGSDSSIMKDEHATLITLRYDEPLHILDDTKDIEIFVTPEVENARQYCGFVKFSDGKYVHLLEENGVKNILQFKFKPSLMYEHDRMGYGFTFGNVGSAKIVEKKVEGQTNLVRTTSDKAPNYAYFVWARDYIQCPQVFGDGRLWIECCAQPKLVDNSDLSAMNFKDEDGESTFSESERSQMMLVVNNVAPETKNSMLDEITNDSKINVSKNDIQKSQTYDIKLSICGKYPTIPDGSYVKIALGFPEGYGPEDEGVAFKLFHRKHIEGNKYVIEEIPCVVTKFGIVATVTSFSPYMVAVVPKEKASLEKTLYASINGKGGTLTSDDGKIQTIKQGGSYTYTIAPDEGYKLYKVTLNGNDITNKVKGGKLTLAYDDLVRNNELEIQYISDEAEKRYSEQNIVDPIKVIVSVKEQNDFFKFDQQIVPDLSGNDSGNGPTTQPDVTPEKSNTGLIISIVAGIGVAIAAGVAIFVIFTKKRQKSKKQS